MKNIINSSITTIIFIFLGVIGLVLTNVKFDLSDYADGFNSIGTPIITAVALLFYYFSLKQLKEQTEVLKEQTAVLKEEKDYLRRDNVYKEMILAIESKKIRYDSYELDNAFKNKISELTKSIVVNPHYKKFFASNDGTFIKGKQKVMPDYNELIRLYSKLQGFLISLFFLIKRINNNEFLDDNQRKRLNQKIADDILYEYFFFNKSQKIANIKIPVVSKDSSVEHKSIFEKYNVTDIYAYYESCFPTMIIESIKINIEL